MNYGLYLSATGVLASSHRQDVIANNLANVETAGFKRSLAMFQARRTEAREHGLNPSQHSNPLLEALGGGISVAPTGIDLSQGDLESSGNPLDVAIQGEGFFAVQDHGRLSLTRDGRMMVNSRGNLALASGKGEVLDTGKRPITVKPDVPVLISSDGTITQGKQTVARLGLFDVPDRSRLTQQGGSLMSGADERTLRPADAAIRNFAVERANVDPATELAALLDAQRQIEANANLIRYQDQTLSRLVNDVGRIG